MRRFFLVAILCFSFTLAAFAQQNDDTPASREDIQIYFETMNSRDSMNKMMDAMLKSIHQMAHDQYLKNKDKLPEDFEQRMTKQMDDMMKNMPLDEMMQAMIPVYQKHLTKGDVYALIAFYNSPTGHKMLRDLPAILSESMDAMMPTMTRYMDEMQKKLQQETEEMIKQAEEKSKPAAKN